ncbi:MAG: hypothetical protein LBI48_01965 [Burkholderiaceae bacterium]|jgi:hypothetical protein|nr:hypothetical protein [Burkholderiaceae bacterium]
MANSALVPVDFHGTSLYATAINGVPHVAIKPICDALTVNAQAQFRRIQRHPVLSKGVAVMAIPSAGGDQETVCLPLNFLNGWLFGISAARVRDAVRRARLIEYQRECFDVLARHFGAAKHALPNAAITAAQAGELYTLIAERFPDGRDRPYAWGRFNNHFHIARYRELPAARFGEALEYIRAMPGKDGALLAAMPALPAPLPRLIFPIPPGSDQYRFDKQNPYPRTGRTIEMCKEIVGAIGCWAGELPDPQARGDLQDATKALHELLVTGWTEVDEALSCLNRAMHCLHRWQGRSGRVGNVR